MDDAGLVVAADMVAAGHANFSAAMHLRLRVRRIVAWRRLGQAISRIWIVVLIGRWHRGGRLHAGALPRRFRICGIDRRVVRRQLQVEWLRRGLCPRRQGQHTRETDRRDAKPSGLHGI
jgi:hypothetical protein